MAKAVEKRRREFTTARHVRSRGAGRIWIPRRADPRRASAASRCGRGSGWQHHPLRRLPGMRGGAFERDRSRVESTPSPTRRSPMACLAISHGPRSCRGLRSSGDGVCPKSIGIACCSARRSRCTRRGFRWPSAGLASRMPWITLRSERTALHGSSAGARPGGRRRSPAWLLGEVDGARRARSLTAIASGRAFVESVRQIFPPLWHALAPMTPQLDPEAQALLEVMRAVGTPQPYALPVEQAREQMRAAFVTKGEPIALHRVEDISLPTPYGALGLRLYRPAAGTRSSDRAVPAWGRLDAQRSRYPRSAVPSHRTTIRLACVPRWTFAGPPSTGIPRRSRMPTSHIAGC